MWSRRSSAAAGEFGPAISGRQLRFESRREEYQAKHQRFIAEQIDRFVQLMQQDVLVHHHPPAAGGRDGGFRPGPPSWRRWLGSGFTSGPRFKSATTC